MIVFCLMACSFRWQSLVFALVVGVLCAASASAAGQAGAAPQRPPLPQPDVADEPYGPHERNRMDLWLAESDAPTPLMIYIHGGGFMGGDKNTANALEIEHFRQNRISYAAINYRLTNKA